MKQLLFVLLAFAFCAHGSETMNQNKMDATELGNSQISFIPTIGLSIFSSVGDGLNSVNSTNGFIGGGLIEMPIPNSITKFQTGVLYLQEGDSVRTSAFTRTNNYLAVPALAKVKFANWNRTSFNLRGGLAPALLMSAKTERDRGTSIAKSDTTSDTKNFDIQTMLGLGTMFSVSSQTYITIDVTYVRGLISYNKTTGDLYNEGFLLTGGMVF